ncbi:MAG: encapsulin [Pseudomonadota bacterium]|nr:encapsulin [Pseudomonadota bacterium]
MANNDPQVPWTDEQWALVAQAVQKEAARSRVAASFLPLIGPLPPDTDFIRGGELTYSPDKPPASPPVDWQTMQVLDRKTIQLTTLQVRVQLRGAQLRDPNLTSALEMFRRAANVLARLEDAVVICGLEGDEEPYLPTKEATKDLPHIWRVSGGGDYRGLYKERIEPDDTKRKHHAGVDLVKEISAKIGFLESKGHFGPFAVVLGETLFLHAQTPTGSMVLPSDRILPFLGGGPLLRSSTLPEDKGFIIALGANPVELVIAQDVSVGFLQVTADPHYVFRVHEKIALRIKEECAIANLCLKKPLPPAAWTAGTAIDTTTAAATTTDPAAGTATDAAADTAAGTATDAATDTAVDAAADTTTAATTAATTENKS